jgi:hypothetical protein
MEFKWLGVRGQWSVGGLEVGCQKSDVGRPM